MLTPDDKWCEAYFCELDNVRGLPAMRVPCG